MGNQKKLIAICASSALALVTLAGCAQPESTTDMDACAAAWPIIEKLSNSVVADNIDEGSLASASTKFKAIGENPKSFDMDGEVFTQLDYLIESTSSGISDELLPDILVHQMSGLADRCEYLNFDVPVSAKDALEEAKLKMGQQD